MNDKSDERIRELLKQALPPVRYELQRDLWPQMLERLQTRAAAVPWFDWALVALLAIWLVASPAIIPLLLYQL